MGKSPTSLEGVCVSVSALRHSLDAEDHLQTIGLASQTLLVIEVQSNPSESELESALAEPLAWLPSKASFFCEELEALAVPQ